LTVQATFCMLRNIARTANRLGTSIVYPTCKARQSLTLKRFSMSNNSKKPAIGPSQKVAHFERDGMLDLVQPSS
jgi:hypothetical protein